MVVELLLTGQQLFPFSAADQYYVASSINGLLTSYPHLQELSNIGVSNACFSSRADLPADALCCAHVMACLCDYATCKS